MPIEEELNEGKKPGSGEPSALQKDLLDTDRDVSGSEAQYTIHCFIRDRLQEFTYEVEAAADAFEAWVNSQQEDFRVAFNQHGFMSFLGQQFMAELANVVGGPGLPLMNAMIGEINIAASFNEHAAEDLSTFINNVLRRGTRDACWYIRDSWQALLGDRLKDIEPLAADGNIEFVPAIYQLGLPSRAFKPADFSQTLIDHAEGYRRSMGLKRDEVKEQVPENKKSEELEKQGMKDMALEEDKKRSVQVL